MTRQNLMNVGRTMVLPVSRLLRGGAVVALALSTSGALAGCALVGDGAQSSQSSAAGVSGEQAMSAPAEKVMSGEYEVGPDGKLLNPNKDLTPPVMPELVKEHSKEGAEALARHYTDVALYMHATGDVSPLRKIAHSDCKYCDEMEAKISRLHNAGKWSKPIVQQIESIGPSFEIPDHPGIWNVDINHLHSVTMHYDGETVEEVEETVEKIHIQLQYEHGQWRIWAVGKG